MKVKQILVIRKDLKMRRGKEIAQGSHASLGAILSIVKRPFSFFRYFFVQKGSPLQLWLDGPFAKICVTVNSEAELLDLHQRAKDAGLLHCLITDSGKTEFHGVPTHTVLAIGPAFEKDVNKITGHLPLY